MDQNDRLRELPAVHEVLERLFPALARFPRALVAAETRRALDELRAEILEWIRTTDLLVPNQAL